MPTLEENLQNLGLNKTLSKIYLFILDNTQVTLKRVMKFTHLSSSGAFKALDELQKKGFIKKMEIENKKLYMPQPMDNIEQELIKKKKEELRKMEETLINLKKGYGKGTIKIRKMGTDYINRVKPMIKKAGKAYEFVDTRTFAFTPKKPKEYKNIDFTLIYVGKEGSSIAGKNISADLNKKYSQILAFENKVVIITTNNETILLENNEIANTIQLLITDLHKKTTKPMNSLVAFQ